MLNIDNAKLTTKVDVEVAVEHAIATAIVLLNKIIELLNDVLATSAIKNLIRFCMSPQAFSKVIAVHHSRIRKELSSFSPALSLVEEFANDLSTTREQYVNHPITTI